MSEVKPDVKDLLHERGYRATPQRLAIYDALWNAGSHPTVAEIHMFAEKRDPTISKATVYKTLELFTEIGLVREIGFRDEPTRYDPETDCHINLVCTRCGKIYDYPCDGFEGAIPDVEEETGFRVQSHHFEIYGICSNCVEK
jgi:Fur family peroxide stress response transcriptional regulator